MPGQVARAVRLDRHSDRRRSGITGQLSTISRADGVTQVSYKGSPLYLFYKDVAVGDATGANVSNWALVKP